MVTFTFTCQKCTKQEYETAFISEAGTCQKINLWSWSICFPVFAWHSGSNILFLDFIPSSDEMVDRHVVSGMGQLGRPVSGLKSESATLPFHQSTKQIPLLQTSFCFYYQMMEQVQKQSGPVCKYTTQNTLKVTQTYKCTHTSICTDIHKYLYTYIHVCKEYIPNTIKELLFTIITTYVVLYYLGQHNPLVLVKSKQYSPHKHNTWTLDFGFLFYSTCFGLTYWPL
jgi:hypothetical protein